MKHYNYYSIKTSLYSEENLKKFLFIRDHVRGLLSSSGAFSMGKAMSCCSGDSWLNMACVDLLKDLGEIKELDIGPVRGQDRVFVANTPE